MTTRGDAESREQATLQFIESTAAAVLERIREGRLPELSFPVRTLKNVLYDAESGYLRLGPGRKTRTLTVRTVKSFAQTLKLMALSRELVRGDDFATKREAYYVSKNWGDARFDDQTESDSVMDDIEALASLSGIAREHLRFYPEEHGGSVAGELVVIDRDPETGERVEVDCRGFGTGSYTVPRSVEHLEFRTDARAVIAIETGGMFQRLNSHKLWDKQGCILVEMGGVPTRATRRFVRRLSDDKDLPVYAFVDCDPYGFANIYRTLKVGSGNAAHINRFFSVPRAKLLGVTPQDIFDYGLGDATHPLSDTDVKRAKDALANDPFFAAHERWVEALQQMLRMGVRAEQQALAKWGLNYVIDEYLPRKLADETSFLP
ncbi:MAG: DNA topoisomerase VI [Polyangiales bacterium]